MSVFLNGIAHDVYYTISDVLISMKYSNENLILKSSFFKKIISMDV
jgi:hypothetical protein